MTTADSKETEFLSSVKAKAFLENGLSDVVSAWVLPNGEVIAVTFQVMNATQPDPLKQDSQYQINSNFYLRHVDQAPVYVPIFVTKFPYTYILSNCFLWSIQFIYLQTRYSILYSKVGKRKGG